MRIVHFYLRSKVLRSLALIYVTYAAWVTCFGDPSEPRIPPYRIDVDVYRLGGLAVVAGEPLYSQLYTTEIGADLPFTYPPIAAQLFALVLAPVSLPYATALVAAATVVALYAVVWVILWDMTEFRGMDLLWATVGVLACVIMMVPFQLTIGFGQINVFLMLLVVVDLTIGRNRWWRGSLIGFAAAFKLTPLVFGLYFLMRRDIRGGIQTLLAFGFWTAVGHLRSPRNSTLYWTEVLVNSGRIGAPDYASNQSITGFLSRSGLSENAQNSSWLVAVLVLGVITAVAMWLLIRRGHHFGAVLAAAFFGLLASPISWSHHWVWAIPALMWLVLRTRRSPQPTPQAERPDDPGTPTSVRPAWLPWLLGAVAVWGWLIFSYAPQFRLPYDRNQEQSWTPFQVVLGNMWVWWTLVFLATLIVVALLDRRDEDSGPVFARQIPRIFVRRLVPTADQGSAGDVGRPIVASRQRSLG